jgi:hypothetical protein
MWLRIRTIEAGCCKDGNEHSGSIKGGQLSDGLREYQLLKGGFA